MQQFQNIRAQVRAIAAEEYERSKSWPAGFGRAEVEYWFEDLPDASVTPLEVKLAVVIAICDLRTDVESKPDISSEEEALSSLVDLVSPRQLAATFSPQDLATMRQVVSSRVNPMLASQACELFVLAGCAQ